MKLLKAMMVGAAMLVAGSAVADDYNRVSISWDNTYYTKWEESTNGIGLNYMHGFSLSSELPMYLELGANLGFNFYGDEDWENRQLVKTRFQNFNVKVPVNFAWKFHVWNDFYISPFAGINFQANYIERFKFGAMGEWSEWLNMLDNKNDLNDIFVEEFGTSTDWNVFQMGWQAGVNLQ